MSTLGMGASEGTSYNPADFIEAYMGDAEYEIREENPYLDDLIAAQKAQDDLTSYWENVELSKTQAAEDYRADKIAAIKKQDIMLEGYPPLIKWEEEHGGTKRSSVTGVMPAGFGGLMGQSNVTGGTTVGTPPDIQSSIDSDVQRMSLPPVNDNLTSVQAPDLAGTKLATGAGEAKSFLQSISMGDIDTEQLKRRIRTTQAGGGMMYGGSAARQEASIVSRFVAGKRLGAAVQLEGLTREEHTLDTKITQLLGQTEAMAASAAVNKITTPTQSLSALLGGTQTGLTKIFGLGSLL
jgi:hypothetical protein